MFFIFYFNVHSLSQRKNIDTTKNTLWVKRKKSWCTLESRRLQVGTCYKLRFEILQILNIIQLNRTIYIVQKVNQITITHTTTSSTRYHKINTHILPLKIIKQINLSIIQHILISTAFTISSIYLLWKLRSSCITILYMPSLKPINASISIFLFEITTVKQMWPIFVKL